jgi:hypothetical protein
MKPRPFYRWKSFWLGLCVLVFLGWSYDGVSKRELRTRSFVYWFASRSGGVSVGRVNVRHLAKLPSRPGLHSGMGPEWHFAGVRDAPPYPRGLAPVFIDRRGDAMTLWLAHWFLILLLLVPWSAWLFWHWKREQRKLTA